MDAHRQNVSLPLDPLVLVIPRQQHRILEVGLVPVDMIQV